MSIGPQRGPKSLAAILAESRQTKYVVEKLRILDSISEDDLLLRKKAIRDEINKLHEEVYYIDRELFDRERSDGQERHKD